ncbi:hypothetical protein OGAPHI_001633 [Ogataea philodendri]|uniref:Diphthine methyltransferase n=1 Tax=Ogataea philodendri TaxID=1378263 RepID=A0A9P8PCL1_9ASCO|nr:uncharacterized protein OGAPHI_001633 [Ogataea philodendri]KAH3669512.1 hypothetical protein OGAPHI_001633 [Ogataea philodendri]
MPSSVSRRLVDHTELPPCALRIHPANPTVVYIGTYKLVKDEERYGSIEIWTCTDSLAKVRSVATASAVLDLKFDPFDATRLVSVHSTGNLIIWKISDDLLDISETFNYQAYENSTLITAINFHLTIPNTLTLSTTAGTCSVLKLNGSDIEKTDFDTEHQLECWFSTFGTFAGLEHVVFSGGDDRKLVAHDARQPELPIWETDRLHDAGIVSVLPASTFWNSTHPYTVWTGSYDDQVRSLDLRVSAPQALISGLPPRAKQTENLGGGVWRLIPNPAGDDRVLCCAMYAGCRMLKSTVQGIGVEDEFQGEHESMVYGGDWVGDNMITCSFYDRVVQVWQDT